MCFFVHCFKSIIPEPCCMCPFNWHIWDISIAMKFSLIIYLNTFFFHILWSVLGDSIILISFNFSFYFATSTIFYLYSIPYGVFSKNLFFFVLLQMYPLVFWWFCFLFHFFSLYVTSPYFSYTLMSVVRISS